MRRAWIAGLLVALAAAGCGSKTATSTHSSSTPTTTSTTSASPTDCNTLGINPTGMREGTCTHNGTTYVIVDEDHTLKLHTLSAHLNSIRTETSIGGTPSTTPNGLFLVLSLSLTNRLAAAQSFDAAGTQQAGLILAQTLYKEDTSVEHSSDASACLRRGGSALAPGHSVTCQVVFDIPAAAATDIGKHGSGDVYLVDFGGDLSGNTPPQTVGQIRLYH